MIRINTDNVPCRRWCVGQRVEKSHFMVVKNIYVTRFYKTIPTVPATSWYYDIRKTSWYYDIRNTYFTECGRLRKTLCLLPRHVTYGTYVLSQPLYGTEPVVRFGEKGVGITGSTEWCYDVLIYIYIDNSSLFSRNTEVR